MKPGSIRLEPSRRKFMSLAAAALAALSGPALAAGGTLRGTVSYRERIALPPEALLEVRLVDVSRAGAPARSLAVTRVKTRHRMPIPYSLHFDEAKINPGHRYAIEARITVGGKLWFITTTRHSALAGKPDEGNILVAFVKSADPAASPLNGRWRAESIRNRGVISDPRSVIEIRADGRVAGSGGCNRISGKADVAGAHISFGPMISTRMACAPAIMDQERDFLSALGDTRLWRFDEQRDKLIFVDAKGITVLKLVRL